MCPVAPTEGHVVSTECELCAPPFGAELALMCPVADTCELWGVRGRDVGRTRRLSLYLTGLGCRG